MRVLRLPIASEHNWQRQSWENLTLGAVFEGTLDVLVLLILHSKVCV